MLLLKVYLSLMEKIKIETQMQFRAYSLMPWLWVLIIVLVTIICWIQTPDMNFIIQ